MEGRKNEIQRIQKKYAQLGKSSILAFIDFL